MRLSGKTVTFVSAGHIIMTPTQPIGSGRPQRDSNPRPPHQESRTLPTELPCSPVCEGTLQLSTLLALLVLISLQLFFKSVGICSVRETSVLIEPV